MELELVARGLGDPDGAFDTFFPDNSVATEAAEFSPEGGRFATVSKSKRSAAVLQLWSSRTHEVLWRATVGGETEAVAWTRDGRLVVTGGEAAAGGGQLAVWDADTGARLSLGADGHRYAASVESLRFSPSGRMLATGDESGHVVVWDTARADPALWSAVQVIDASEGGTGPQDINQIDWTADGRALVTAQRNGTVAMYAQVQPPGAAPRFALERRFAGFAGQTVKSVRIAPDQSLVAAGAGDAGGVRVWDLATGAPVRHLASESSPRPEDGTGQPLAAERFETVLFSPDSQTLLVGGTWRPGWVTDNGFDPVGHPVPISLFRVSDLRTPAGAPRPFRTVRTWRQEYLQFDPAGRHLLSSHDDGAWRLWAVGTGCED